MQDNALSPIVVPVRGRHRALPSAFLLLIPGLLFACRSAHYDSLRSEDEIPKLRRLKDQLSRLPFRTRHVQAGTVRSRPLHMAFHEIGEGTRDRAVVLIHGMLSDSGTWRFLAGDLGRDHDLILMDLPGCGQSDKPDPDLAGPDSYSPSSLARRVLLGLREVLKDRPSETRITLVAQSFGGMVALRMMGCGGLGREFSDVLARVDQLVLIAPGDFAIEKVYPVFKKITEVTEIEVVLANLLGILQDSLAKFTRQCAVDQEAIVPREEADRLIDLFWDDAKRRAAQAMILQAVPFREDGRPDWPKIERLVADYGNIEIPCLIIWGTRDETLPLSMGFKLAEQIPQAKLCVVTHSMHTLQRERPILCANLIRQFVATSGEGMSDVSWIDPSVSSAEGFAFGEARGHDPFP